MKKLKETLFYLFIILLVILISNIAYFKFIKKEKIVSLFGKTIFIVETGSMSPTICEGELILVSREKEYAKEDIVTILDYDGYIYTHRIVEVMNDSIITKGDNNDINDEKMPIEKIVGKVIFHSKYLGLFVLFLLKPLVIIIIFIMALKIIIFLVKEFLYEKKLNN